MNINYILILIACYFFGSIPIGYLIAKANGKDITKLGSGNVGATNVARNLGKTLGAVTLLLDLIKGFIPVYIISKYFCSELTELSAFIVVLGHCFSIPYLFKGGKGVATSTGAVLALRPELVLIGLILFLIIFYFTRYVSLASIVAELLVGILSLNLAIIAITLLVIYRHHENIDRLLKNKESKFSAGSP